MQPGNINLFKQGWVAPIPPSLPKTHPLFGDIARIRISLWRCQSPYIFSMSKWAPLRSPKNKNKNLRHIYISLRHPIQLLSFSKWCSLLTCSNFQSAPNFPISSKPSGAKHRLLLRCVPLRNQHLAAKSSIPQVHQEQFGTYQRHRKQKQWGQLWEFMLHMYITTRVMMANSNHSSNNKKTIMMSKRCGMMQHVQTLSTWNNRRFASNCTVGMAQFPSQEGPQDDASVPRSMPGYRP